MEEFEIHSIVKAANESYGEYIGKVVGFRNNPAPVYYVRILACTKYPNQYALLIKDVHFKRHPYPYLSIQNFSKSNVRIYKSDVPEYEHSVNIALKESQRVS